MALGDWTQQDVGSWTISLDVTTPMVDSGSLNMIAPTAAGANAHTFVLAPPFSKGFTKGKIRTLLRWDTGAEMSHANLKNFTVGIICMMSAADITTGGGGGDAYLWGMGSADVQTNVFDMVLVKITDGLATNLGDTVIFQDDAPGADPPAAGAFWPFELEWVADLAGLGGTRLTGRCGTQGSSDFGTLADKIDTIDTSSPILTSVGEGIYGRRGDTGGTTPGKEWSLDTTSVFELV